MGLIEFNHVNKTFPNGYEVVQNLNLKIDEGDFAIFVGAPGSGKSTVLRMAAGLEEPTMGEVRIGGELLRNIPPEDRNVAMVFQNYALYPKLNVYENIGFGLKQRNIPQDIIERKVLETAEFFEIEDLLKKKPRNLSASERQRVALSRSVVTEPKILILDEPLASFEEPLRLRLREKIKEAQKKTNRTILYVTHNLDDAMYLATKLIVMKKGRIHQAGTPKEVYEHPKTMFTASFIGEPEVNLIDGTCEIWGPKAYVSTPIAQLSLRASLESKLLTRGYNDKVIVAGLRPDAFSLVEAGSDIAAKKHNLVKTTVETVEEFKGLQWVRFSAENILYNALLDTKKQLTPGESIMMLIDSSKILVYDKISKTILN